MTYNRLPPQAYTKDDVTKAYVWLQSQPDYVRNMATTKETLVALYLRARRGGDASLENIAPVSSKNFKSQLQTLANELEQFGPSELEKPLTPVQEQPQVHIHQTIQQNFQDFQKPMGEAPSQPKVDGFIKDARTEQIIETVKTQLNLESESDVVRMLLVLGYERIKDIFPARD
jgi:hypothetical protein